MRSRIQSRYQSSTDSCFLWGRDSSLYYGEKGQSTKYLVSKAEAVLNHSVALTYERTPVQQNFDHLHFLSTNDITFHWSTVL